MEPPVIQNFKRLIEPNLNGAELISFKTNFLTKPGDNYGSVMLGIVAVIQKPNAEPEELQLVGKVPPMSEELMKSFRVELTFIREVHFYTHIMPACKEFEQEMLAPEAEKIDILAKDYGSRISLNPNAEDADKDATLLLENLVAKGYVMGKRKIGFDYDTTLCILENLAKYHAILIALRYSRPEIYKAAVSPTAIRIDMDYKESPERVEHIQNLILADVEKAVGRNEKILEQVAESNILYRRFVSNENECADSIWTTVIHNDFWVNNMMVLYDSNGKKPLKVRIFDFQMTMYESLGHDLLFFLFTSVQLEVLDKSFKEFLQFYYEKFVYCMTLYCCPCGPKMYTYARYSKELNRLALIQLPHILFMLRIIMGDNPDANFEVYDLSSLLKENWHNDVFYRKVAQVIEKYKGQGWIK